MSSNNNKFIVAAGLAFAAWGISKLISAENSNKMMKKSGVDGYKERSKFERQMSGVPLGESHGGPHTAKPKKFRGNINVNENCIATQRERMKETCEYKKALHEELASRQKALAIQAQEAKKLKLMLRRKKAESKRLLEMEKRQKQRVEEMRETQKKDVENMNLKEQLRVEVGKELSQLEMTCHDMASVLCRLGIAVGHGTTHEVRVAYRKALLKFHPDRSSRSDIRQQVEAEEKFKLISRMKDKYLPTL